MGCNNEKAPPFFQSLVSPPSLELSNVAKQDSVRFLLEILVSTSSGEDGSRAWDANPQVRVSPVTQGSPPTSLSSCMIRTP